MPDSGTSSAKSIGDNSPRVTGGMETFPEKEVSSFSKGLNLCLVT